MYIVYFSRIAVLQEGKDPLPHCDVCGMHMLARRIIKHQRMRRYNRNMHMRWQRRDVAIVSQCMKA